MWLIEVTHIAEAELKQWQHFPILELSDCGRGKVPFEAWLVCEI